MENGNNGEGKRNTTNVKNSGFWEVTTGGEKSKSKTEFPWLKENLIVRFYSSLDQEM